MAFDYTDLQNPSGGYGGSQQPGTLYAGTGGAGSPPKQSAPPKPPGPLPATKSVIHVSVNPASKITAAAMVALLNGTPGAVPEFKNKITFDKKAKDVAIPDYSRTPVVTGKEWIIDLGKAGNDWEVTTGVLAISLDGDSFSKLQEDIGKGTDEERGHPTSDDPDESLMRPSRDLTNVRAQGLMLGLTIPNSSMVAKNPPDPQTVPKAQIARLQSGKGLIILAREVTVEKRQKVAKEKIPVPKSINAMILFHELAAHASFFQLGQAANHGDQLVDRNVAQAEATYKKALAKELATLQQKALALIDKMDKAVP